MKDSGRKIIILLLYVVDILLVTNDIWLSYDVKNFLSKNFEINNMSETSYVIRI